MKMKLKSAGSEKLHIEKGTKGDTWISLGGRKNTFYRWVSGREENGRTR